MFEIGTTQSVLKVLYIIDWRNVYSSWDMSVKLERTIHPILMHTTDSANKRSEHYIFVNHQFF